MKIIKKIFKQKRKHKEKVWTCMRCYKVIKSKHSVPNCCGGTMFLGRIERVRK